MKKLTAILLITAIALTGCANLEALDTNPEDLADLLETTETIETIQPTEPPPATTTAATSATEPIETDDTPDSLDVTPPAVTAPPAVTRRSDRTRSPDVTSRPKSKKKKPKETTAEKEQKLSKEMEERILDDYWYWVNSFWKREQSERDNRRTQILQYLGTYNGSIVVLIEQLSSRPGSSYIEIEGYGFGFSSENFIWVWNDGEIHRMQTTYKDREYTIIGDLGAYDLGLLTIEDIANIQRLYYKFLGRDVPPRR